MDCLARAFAKILQVNIEEMFEEIGHDGSEIIFPELSHPYNRRGFHPRELIDFCLCRGLSVTQIERYPLSRAPISHTVYSVPTKEDSFLKYLRFGNGVLTGSYPNRPPHAIPWFVGKSELENFFPRIFFLIQPIRIRLDKDSERICLDKQNNSF
jgi:hypothetical protein